MASVRSVGRWGQSGRRLPVAVSNRCTWSRFGATQIVAPALGGVRPSTRTMISWAPAASYSTVPVGSTVTTVFAAVTGARWP